MTAQTKTLLIGAGTAGAAKFYFQKSWQMSLIFAAVAMTAFLVITDLPESST